MAGMRIVLASQSPSRRKLLTDAGITPAIHPAHVDEDAIQAALPSSTAPSDVVAALARAKSEAVAAQYPDDVVIAADSMLLLDGTLQGKPHTVDAAIERWRTQSGRTAELLTGHCISYRDQEFTRTTSTRITFGTPTEDDIAAYALSGEPLEVAGAFTLEARGGLFVDAIEGDPSSVIGLSLPLVREALYSFGLSVTQFWEK